MNGKRLLLISVLLLSLSGTCFATTDGITKSIDNYTQQIQSDPQSAYAYSNRGSMRFLKQDFKGALSDFDNAIKINPQNHELYLNRGYVKQFMNDLNGALEDYNQVLKLRPNYAYAYNNRGVLKVALNDINGALEDYDKALSLNPKYADVYYNRGNLKYMLNDNEGALEDYDSAIKYNPNDADAYNNRGVVKKRMNYNVGALSDYSKAIAINPQDSIALANRGHLKRLYFDSEGATIDLEQAVKLAENQTFIKNVKPLLSNEHYIAAIPSVKGMENKFDSINPNIKTVSQNLKTAYARDLDSNIPAKTNNQLEPVKKSQPRVEIKPAKQTQTSINSTKTQSVLKNGTPVISTGIGTVKAAEPPVTTTPIVQDPTTNVRLAESYYIRALQKCIMHDFNGAMSDLNKAITYNSDYADAYLYRAAIRKELGDLEGFRTDYANAIKINPALQQYNEQNSLSVI